MSTNSVTVCIPSIPSRSNLLATRAIPSVLAQNFPASEIAVSIDRTGLGGWANRNKTIEMAGSEWIAFLDDDDELLPNHLELLVKASADSGADVCWGWFDVVGGTDPFPQHRGRQWDPENPHIFPITALIRRSLVLDSGATFKADPDNTGNWGVQDYPFWRSLSDAGGKFCAIHDTTWRWYHHENNTSGLPSRH